ncbi:hypothetical protein [Metabacillus malikii]|uniref:Uncharacterized protein n=1 Tax=Metabacillus malikii TaxID=1504265 RepID=A0ABT9ZJH3_9BACI|nr:hypothetical protein [Metabacillus malikii]MDQ0232435.1 hypothetical protein [Metabacillus malikii]
MGFLLIVDVFNKQEAYYVDDADGVYERVNFLLKNNRNKDDLKVFKIQEEIPVEYFLNEEYRDYLRRI